MHETIACEFGIISGGTYIYTLDDNITYISNNLFSDYNILWRFLNVSKNESFKTQFYRLTL